MHSVHILIVVYLHGPLKGALVMANNDLRLQQRAKLLARGVNKPAVTLSRQQSREASDKSIQLVAKAYDKEPMQLA